MSLIAACLRQPSLIVSVMGPHAGETPDGIFKRKVKDIEKVGWTLWVIRSHGASAEMVQRMYSGGGPLYVVFIEPAVSGGAVPTKTNEEAREYSPDRLTWSSLPRGLGPVTGRMSRTTCALRFDRLEVLDGVTHLDLWTYADHARPGIPGRTKIGYSTICAVRGDTSRHDLRMKSRYRRIVAAARLQLPGAVWLR